MRKLVIGLSAAMLVTGLAACNNADETTPTTEATTEVAPPAIDAAPTEAAPTDATTDAAPAMDATTEATTTAAE